MKPRTVMQSCVVCVALAAGARAQQIGVQDAQRFWSAYQVSDQDGRAALVAEMAARADREFESGSSGYSEADRLAGHAALRLGDRALTLRMFEKAIRRAETPEQQAGFLRMVGRVYGEAGQWPEARGAYEQILAIVTGDGGIGAREAVSFEAAVFGIADAATLAPIGAGRSREAAIEARRLITERWPDSVRPGALRTALIANARDLSRLGRTAEAVAAYEQFFALFPEAGREDGSVVPFRMELARIRDPGRASEGYLQEVGSIWEDPALREFPQSLNAGNWMAKALRDQHGDLAGAFEVFQQVALHGIEREKAWRASPRFGRSVAGMDSELEFALWEVAHLGEKLGDYATALWAAEELCDRYEPRDSEFAAQLIERLTGKLD